MHENAPVSKNLIVRIFSWVKFEETRDPSVVFLIINESPASVRCQKQDREKHRPLPGPLGSSESFPPRPVSPRSCLNLLGNTTQLLFICAENHPRLFYQLELGDRRRRRHTTQPQSTPDGHAPPDHARA